MRAIPCLRPPHDWVAFPSVIPDRHAVASPQSILPCWGLWIRARELCSRPAMTAESFAATFILYSFNTADNSAAVLIYYSYMVSSGNKISLANQLTGRCRHSKSR